MHALSRRSILFLSLTLCLLITTTLAHAAGRVEWKSKEFKEREGGSWRLEVALFLARAPDVAHVPMKFEFEPIAYYERSMIEGDKLVERTVPLEHRQALIESADVGFLDTGSGKIEKRTRFTFKLTRAHGYEAGEYKVTIRDGRNGQTVGTPTTLKFAGENEVIDRRPMVFTGKKKEKPKEDAKEESKGEEGASSDSEKAESAATKSDDSGAESTESSSSSESNADDDGASNASEGPPAEKKKPGGCGCRFDSGSTDQPYALGAVLLGAAVLLGRRQRRAA